MDHWRQIRAFPGHSVSYTGDVRNDTTEYWLKYHLNQRGSAYVAIWEKGVLYNRSVGRLVADAFLPPPKFESFDTPIHLDGNVVNNHMDNLMWRPRWFAVRYKRQFFNPSWNSTLTFEEIDTGLKFNSSLIAAMKFGLLAQDLSVAARNREEVWPTGQRFRIVA